MSDAPSYLRIYRKRSPLTQGDIAFLMGLSEYSSISRYEKGQRTPSIEFLLVYHHLFNESIQSFFDPASANVLSNLIIRIEKLIGILKENKSTVDNLSRIKFLEEVIIRLTT